MATPCSLLSSSESLESCSVASLFPDQSCFFNHSFSLLRPWFCIELPSRFCCVSSKFFFSLRFSDPRRL